MNMHMGQNVLAETELRCLAAIPFQIISPANNAPIIAIYQDSLLGSYRFTRDVIEFSPRDAMNLLMSFERVNIDALLHKDVITNFDILSQIMPPLTLKYKTELWDNEREKDKDPALSNNILEIRNGQYLRGQLEKKSLGGGGRGLIHRICNDFGNRVASDFIDDLQNVITEYMKQSSYSVGVSDLISNQQTSDEIAKILQRRKMEVAELIQKVHTGVFENNTSHTNQVEFETQVNNILNDATKDSDKVSRTSLQQDNRFLMIVNSGSKGSLLNISHMMSCLGQVNVDAKRVSYGFDSRTLPHFSKFDDSPAARGFIENSYINGLSASELFFHAMGGRVGLIDTAVKSVAWETPVFIRVNDNLVYTEIGRWIDGLLDNPNFRDQVVYSPEDRNMESMNVPHNVYIHSMSMKGAMSFKSVTHVCRHDPGDVLFEIATASGRKVIVTASKSLLVWNRHSATFEERFTTDIHVGDLLPVHHKCLDFGYYQNPSWHGDKSYKYSSLEIMEMVVQICKWKQENVIPVDFFQDSRNPPILVKILLQLYESGDLDVVVCQSQRDCDFISMAFTSTSRTVMIGEPFTIFLNSATFLQHSTINDVAFDPIVSMRAIDPTSDERRFRKMYDITVPSTLNFGLANGLQVRDTSQTGYIQRRLIKGLEDLKVEYDMTVRNNKGKIIEFVYGDDGFDPMKTEGQDFPLLSMTIEDIFMHYDFDDKSIGELFVKETAAKFRKEAEAFKTRSSQQIATMLGFRDEMVEKVFRFKDDTAVIFPVAFRHLINMVQGNFYLNANSLVDLTPLRFYELVDQYFAKIQSIRCVPVSRVFQAMYYFFLNPRDIIHVRRFHEKAVVHLLETILLKYKQAIVHPGEMVGVVAAQSIGEPTTQMTLNSFVYETEVLVRDSKGRIRCVQIGDFTKDGIATSPKIEYYEDKDTTYAELKDFYEVPSCTEDGRTVWRRIEAVTKHPVINEDGSNTMLKVTTKGNREIIATRAKSFLQLVDGKIQAVNGSDLKVGDYLPVSKKPLDFTESDVLDLREVLPMTEYIYGDEVEKARAVCDESFWWKKHANKTFTLPYRRSDSCYVMLKGTRKGYTQKSVYLPGHVYTTTNTICNYLFPDTIPLDYEFGYLAGAYCAEGCMTEHQVSIANNDQEFFEPIKRWCARYNLTTKIYVHENKCQEGWTSTDIRIYSTLLCRVLDALFGRLSHNKFVSDKIMFSNRACIKGFLDAYISGDGHVHKDLTAISIHSVSLRLLTNVQVMMKNMGVLGKINKATKPETNNRGTKPENIHQGYILMIANNQCKILAAELQLSIAAKRERISQILSNEYRVHYCMADANLPNKRGGIIVTENRNNRCIDTEFDKIVAIDEVPNTTNYAYDLTVEDTRNFNTMNGVCASDTFHLSGVASKSNVTRGVPRIEEILRLTKNPKNPSLTIHLLPMDESNAEKAKQFATMIEHTKLSSLVKTVQICFDPHDEQTTLEEDRAFLDQYYAFAKLFGECNGKAPSNNAMGEAEEEEEDTKSKWIVRMEMDTEAMLDKNITMDDIHFALQMSPFGLSKELHCVYSDFNADKLVFRLRVDKEFMAKDKKRRGIPDPLDQSNEIHFLKRFQDKLLNSIVLRGVEGIEKVIPRKLQNMVEKTNGQFARKDTWVLDTTGTNLMECLALDFIDTTRTFSNDIREIYDVLGIEAARQVIHNELVEVMQFSGAYVNYHHVALLCDRMTCNENMVAIFRNGLFSDDIGPVAKATFEVHTEVLLDAARYGDFDSMRGVSANVMCGQPGYYGTNAFQLVLDMDNLQRLHAETVSDRDAMDIVNEELEREVLNVDETGKQLEIFVHNDFIAGPANHHKTVIVDDDYDIGF